MNAMSGYPSRRPMPLAGEHGPATGETAGTTIGCMQVTFDPGACVESCDGNTHAVACGQLTAPHLLPNGGPTGFEQFAAFMADGGDLNEVHGTFLAVIAGPQPDTIRLCRDHPGSLPVYFAIEESGLLFSTDYDRLRAGTTAPVRCLQPGNALTVRAGQASLERFYAPHAIRIGDDPVSTLDDLLFATTSRMLSDRRSAHLPIHTFLSGGVDSSLVAYYLSRVAEDLTAVTITGKDVAFAQRVIAVTGTDHELISITDESWQELKSIYPRREYNASFYDLTNSLFVPNLVLCSFVRDHGGQVAFGGAGSDEIFASYNRHLQYMSDISYATRQIMDDCHVFLLEAIHLASVLTGVTCHSPFFDREVIDFALALPDELKIRNSVEKWIVRKVAERYLPKEVAWREPGPLQVTTRSFENINNKSYYESYYW